MRKRTLLSHIKAVKRLVLLTLILAAAFPATIREAKAAAGTTFKVKVTDGYLALRSEKAFDKGNEIGQLNTGDLVEVTNRRTLPTGMHTCQDWINPDIWTKTISR